MTYTMNVESLTSPGEVRASPNTTTSTDHNLYIHAGHVFESNYTSGLRIFDEEGAAAGCPSVTSSATGVAGRHG